MKKILVIFLLMSLLVVSQAMAFNGLDSGSNFNVGSGDSLTIGVSGSDSLTVHSQGVEARVNTELFQKQDRLMVRLSNGLEKEVLLTPDKALVKAKNRLNVSKCSEYSDCSVELSEATVKGVLVSVYEVPVVRKVRVLGFLDTEMTSTVLVDSESEEITIRNPWWSVFSVVEE